MMAPPQPWRTAGQSAVECYLPQPAAHVRLVAFAHAGGGPLTFRRWARKLAPDVELWHVTLPGRAGRRHEPFAREWAPVVGDLAAAVIRDVPAPIALFGHSLGALLAFEVARRLTSAGVAPVHLIVSGCGAPNIAFTAELPDSDDDLLRDVDVTYGGVPAQVRASRDVLEYFLPMLRADLELARAYVHMPGAALTCPITAITGDADPVAPPSRLEGWCRQTDAGCELCVLSGGHFVLVERESAVLSKIVSRLSG